MFELITDSLLHAHAAPLWKKNKVTDELTVSDW